MIEKSTVPRHVLVQVRVMALHTLDEKAMETERRRQLRTLCYTKCKDMVLTNHITGFNCLKKLGDPHRSNLKRMGYSLRVDFSVKHVEGRKE